MKALSKIIASVFIFIVPIIIIIGRYDNEKTIRTESGMGFFVTTIVSLLILTLVGYVLSNFNKVLREDKFGTLSLLVYGVLILSLFSLIGLGLNWVVNSATESVELFVNNMEYHLNTIKFIGMSMILGIIVLIFDLSNKIKRG